MNTKPVIPPATIGFVGLGNMGYPMAKRLVDAGYKLVVTDLNGEAVQKFCKETGSTCAQNLQQLGSLSDAVITMLPEGKAVRKVLMQAQGVASTLRPGAIVIDMSSCSPVDTRILSAELRQQGFDMIDAPVSGGVVKAVAGGLAIMAGGSDDAINASRSLLEVMGKVFATGGSGTGHAMKAMNNFLSAATLAITSEAVLTGAKFGLDPAVMVDIINASTGRSNSSEHKFPTFILPRKFNSGFFLGLMAKDLRFAKALNEAMHTPGELLSVISAMWDKAEAELGFHADNTEIHKYLEAHSDDSA